MLAKISLALFGLFLTYRAYFWTGFWENFPKVSLLALSDTIVCVGAISLVYYLVEHRLNLQRRLWLYSLAWLLIIALAIISLLGLHWLGYTITGAMTATFSNTFRSFGFQIFDSFTLVMVGTTGGYSAMKFREAYESKNHLSLLQREQEHAELNFLKSQMNPHFIFNSLNTIFFSIEKGHPARDIVSTFSDLLRFQLYECSQDVISLKQEIAFLKQYLLLFEIRMSDSTELDVNLPTKIPNHQIAPLLIIPFIENALKHASSMKGEKRKVRITIEIKPRALYFEAINSLNIHDKNPPNKKGIGIKNARRRMDLLFGHQYNLKTTKSDLEYSVALKIPLQ